MDTVYEVRLRNYYEIRQKHREMEGANYKEHGSLTRFARQVKVGARYISQIECDRKPIGSTMARKLEVGFNLEVGWMDHEHATGTLMWSPKARGFFARVMRLYLRSPESMEEFLAEYLEKMVTRLPPEDLPGKSSNNSLLIKTEPEKIE